MTPPILTLIRSTLTFFVLVLSSVITAQSQSATGETQLAIAKEGLEATLRLEVCGETTLVTIAWKNTNVKPVMAVLTLKGKNDQSLLLMTTTRLTADAVKAESCESVDHKSRSVAISNFADVVVDLTVIQ